MLLLLFVYDSVILVHCIFPLSKRHTCNHTLCKVIQPVLFHASPTTELTLVGPDSHKATFCPKGTLHRFVLLF